MMVSDFSEVIRALQKEHVKFLLIGGIAAIGHGMTHATNDIDICYERSRENIKAMVRALKSSKPQLRVPGGSLPFLFDEKTIENGLNFTLDTEWGWVDLLAEITGLGGYDTLIRRTVKMKFYDQEVDAISLNDLIKAKQLAGRTKDKLHLLELEAIRDIIEKNK